MMPVLLQRHFLLTWMRTVSSAAVMSTHAWDGEIFGKPRDLLNLDVLQRSGWTGPGWVRWNAFKNCSVSVHAIKVTLYSCGENWARHLFRRSESAVGFTSFSVWERGNAFKIHKVIIFAKVRSQTFLLVLIPINSILWHREMKWSVIHSAF